MKRTINALIFATLILTIAQFVNAAPPVNDNWANGIVISGTSGTVTGTNAEGTLQDCEPTQHAMPDEGGMSASRTVWYKFDVDETASYTFRINSAAFGSILSAYRISLGLCNGNVQNIPYRIIENANYNMDLGTGLASRISFKAVAGEIIYIAVDTNNQNVAGAFEIGWEKSIFRYHTQLDYKNSGADLAMNRRGTPNLVRWTARYGPTAGFNRFAAIPFGFDSDYSFYADFDGDSVSDNVAVRVTGGNLTWYVATQQGVVIQIRQFGLATDKPLIGDFDGDGMADMTVYRAVGGQPTTWHILRSSDGAYTTFTFGASFDRPFVGDYDGDRISDAVMIRGTPDRTWYIRKSSTGEVVQRLFGGQFDIPQVADFDGDGKTDVTVWRRGGDTEEWSGYWFWIPSSSAESLETAPISFRQFGEGLDYPQAADYDGDSKTDLAVIRHGNWWIESSRTGMIKVESFGFNTDWAATDMGLPYRGITP